MDPKGIHDLARKVVAGEVGVPFLDQVYVTEDQLIDLGLSHGWDMIHLSFCLENELLLPQREPRLFHAASAAQRLAFIREMEAAEFSRELQQVIMAYDHQLEQRLWDNPEEAAERQQIKARDPLGWALLHITHALAVGEAVNDIRQQIVSQEFTDIALARDFRRFLQEAGRRRRQRNRRLAQLMRQLHL